MDSPARRNTKRNLGDAKCPERREATSRKRAGTELATEVVEKVDEKLVEEAVEEIRAIVNQTTYKAVIAIGELVFRKFFKSDSALVASRDPKKVVSFRALLERCGDDIPISRAWLHSAVVVASVRHQLPEGAAYRQLPASHQAALGPVRDPEVAEKLAKRAAAKELTVRQIKEIVKTEVAKAKGDTTGRGRPRMPTITRALRQATAAFSLEGQRLTKGMVDELGEDDVRGALKEAKALAVRVASLIEKLEARA